jgi:osmoprotectant transport system permease protein
MFAGWLTLKANRLAQGEHHTLLSAAGGVFWVLLGLWLIALLLALAPRRRELILLRGATGTAILIWTGIVVSGASTGLLEGATSSARVALGGGFWLSLLAVYIVIYTASSHPAGSRPLQLAVALTGPLALGVMLVLGMFDDLSIMREYLTNRDRFGQELFRHLMLAGVSVGAAALAGVSLGVWAARHRRSEKFIFAVTNITQTIPSLALFGLMIAPLSFLSFQFPFLREIGIRGIGVAPAVIALFIYSLLPIVRNTFIGLRQIDAGVMDAGRGMGMSRGQLFRRIEIPLAMPLILEGLRIASVQAVGLTAVAALIGAGGLGWFIFQGLGQAAPDMILLGTLPIIALALVVDAVMRLAIILGSPRGLGGSVT